MVSTTFIHNFEIRGRFQKQYNKILTINDKIYDEVNKYPSKGQPFPKLDQ